MKYKIAALLRVKAHGLLGLGIDALFLVEVAKEVEKFYVFMKILLWML
ncbi:hypothetical protein X975_01900, partial [Stegodyphus mimosarum]